MALKMPVMGNIVRNSAIARFARTLGVTFRAGVPLVEALDAVAGATGSVVYGDAVRQMRDDIAVGHQLQLAMKQTGLFPNMVVQMTAIGEESGALDNMLFKVAEFYEEEVEQRGRHPVHPARAAHHGGARRPGRRHGDRAVPADLQARRHVLSPGRTPRTSPQ